MIKKIAFVLVILGANRCVAQSNDLQVITNWGQNVQGVQFAVTVTTNVFKFGSSSVVTFVTKNFSTNTITVFVPASMSGSDVILTNDTGKLYHIISHPKNKNADALLSGLAPIDPGAEVVESIPVTFGENIEPGDYDLKATRHFSSGKVDFTLESNLIKLRIVK
jgi:hypothetical protein